VRLNDRQQVALSLLNGRKLTRQQVGNWIGQQSVSQTLLALVRRGLVTVDEIGGREVYFATPKGSRKAA